MFAEMPRDRRAAVTFAGPAAALGFAALFGRLDRRRMQNDLIFRGDWQFCNIEPKICQHG
jgi:hypothetical protein